MQAAAISESQLLALSLQPHHHLLLLLHVILLPNVGLSLALGLSAGMETLCGQAYGAGAYTRVGVILQRALLVCWTVCIPVGFLWLNSHALLLQLGQQPGMYLQSMQWV
jgi:Na+-driven multidrug efflux pump